MNLQFTEKQNKFNVDYYYNNPIRQWITHINNKKYAGRNQNDIDKIISTELSKKIPLVKEQCEEVALLLISKFNGKIKPIHNYMNLFNFIHDLLEVFSVQNLFQRNAKLSEEFNNTALSALTQMRYAIHTEGEPSEAVTQAESFFTSFFDCFLHSSESDKNLNSDTENLSNLIKIVSKNPEILDISFTFFLEKKLPDLSNIFFTKKTSIIHLKNYLHEGLEKIKKNFILIANLSEPKLKEHLNLKRFPGFDSATDFLKRLATFRTHKLHQLNTHSLENISELVIVLPKLKELLNEFFTLFNNIGGSNVSANFGDCSNLIEGIRIILNNNKNKPDDGLINLDDYSHTKINGVEIIFLPEIKKGIHSIKELKEFLFFCIGLQHIHEWGDTFISPLTSNISNVVIPILLKWHTSYSKDPNFVKLLEEISPPKQKISLKDQIKLINGSSVKKKNTKKTKKISLPIIIKEIDVSSENTVEPCKKLKSKKILAENNEDCEIFSEAFLKDDLEILSLLSNELTSLDDSISPEAFAALRESLMYLKDALLLSKQIKNIEKVDPSQRSFILIEFIRRIHDLAEQVLRYKNFVNQLEDNSVDVSFGHHNLKGLYKQLNPKDTKTPSIISKYFLANFWLDYHSTQNNLWKSDSSKILPPLLGKIGLIIQDPKSEKIKELPKELVSDFNQALNLIRELIPIKEKNSKTKKIEAWKSIDLSLKDTIDAKKLYDLFNQTDDLMNKIKWNLSHPIFNKFKQIKNDIKLLIDGYLILNKPISSITLSSVVRSVLCAQSRLVEQILQLIIELKTGESVLTHDIEILCSPLLNTNQKVDPSAFLKKEYRKSHYTGRNPFQEKAVVNSFHEIILKTELIRECPEFTSGFETQQNHTETLLNYIPIPSKKGALDYQLIFKDLKLLYDQTIFILSGELSKIKVL